MLLFLDCQSVGYTWNFQGFTYFTRGKLAPTSASRLLSAGASEVAKEVFALWRRSYDIPPPPGPNGFSESLETVHQRTIPYYRKEIYPLLSQGKNVLISAHGNSLRSLSMKLFDFTEEDIKNFTFPLGIPVRIRFKAGGPVASVQIIESSNQDSSDSKNVAALVDLLQKKEIHWTIVQLPSKEDSLLKAIRDKEQTKFGELFLIRHSQTISSDTLPGGGYFAGWLDVELTEAGQQQAEAAGKALGQLLQEAGIRIAAAFTSDLSRSIGTLVGVTKGMGSKIIWMKDEQELGRFLSTNPEANEIPTVKSPAIKERHYGALQGERREEIMITLTNAIEILWNQEPHMRDKDPRIIAQRLSERWGELTALIGSVPIGAGLEVEASI